MSTPITAKFLASYPGPFGYDDGSDCVDATFDISCLRTGKHIASTYYWDNRLPSELVVRVITELLNDLPGDALHYLRPNPKHLSPLEIAAFRGMYPGPYRNARTKCDYRGPGYAVRSVTTGDAVIRIYNRSARLVTAVIAELLNKLP